MIRTGEKLIAEIFDLPEHVLGKIRDIEGVYHADFSDNRLTARYPAGGRHLISVLDTLRQGGVAFGSIISEPPTLNDVFLEITGKELKD